MTYNVFGGTLNLALSKSIIVISHQTVSKICLPTCTCESIFNNNSDTYITQKSANVANTLMSIGIKQKCFRFRFVSTTRRVQFGVQ